MAELLSPRRRCAAVLRAGRKKRGLTQTALAAQLGVSYAMIRGIETGRRTPSFDLLTKLVLHLHVDAFSLFYDDDLIR